MKFGNLVTYSYLCNHKRLKLRKNIEVQTNQGMKTIAEQIKWDFKTNGDLKIKDKDYNTIYYEDSTGFWAKREYDSKGNEIYYENSYGSWVKMEYDSKGDEIYYEDSSGEIRDNRPKLCESKEIVIEGVKYKLVKQ